MPRIDVEGELPGKLAIYVYADHLPPHFHVRSPGSNAVIELETLRVLRGHVSRKDHAAMIDWANVNRQRLRQAWRRMNERD